MKRKYYDISVNGILVETRSAWNASMRAIESRVRDVARLENQTYVLADRGVIKGDFESIIRTWKGMKIGQILKFEIVKRPNIED